MSEWDVETLIETARRMASGSSCRHGGWGCCVLERESANGRETLCSVVGGQGSGKGSRLGSDVCGEEVIETVTSMQHGVLARVRASMSMTCRGRRVVEGLGSVYSCGHGHECVKANENGWSS